MTKTPLLLAATSLLTLAPGCFNFIADKVLDDVLPCGGKLFEELEGDDGLSAECRADIAPYLPEPESNFDGRLVTLGHDRDAVGAVSIYLHGVDDGGHVLTAADWDGARVMVWSDGEAVELAAGELEVEVLGDSSERFMSIAMVNDYSGSMLDSDLDDVEALQLDVLECLPPQTEGAVTYFSEEVVLAQDFTEERGPLEGALRRNDEFERSMTALYDGMGDALEHLVERDRPVRVLMVSSDGLENASDEWEQEQLLELVEAEGVTVVMLGALFADIDQMRTLTQHDGVFFYTPFYADMGHQLDDYVTSLKQMARITLPSEYAEADRVEIEVDGQVAVLTMD